MPHNAVTYKVLKAELDIKIQNFSLAQGVELERGILELNIAKKPARPNRLNVHISQVSTVILTTLTKNTSL